MTQPQRWPYPVVLVIGWLTQELNLHPSRVQPILPADLDAPMVWVTQPPSGSADEWTSEMDALVDVQTFTNADDLQMQWSLARSVMEAMHALPGKQTPHGIADRVTVTLGMGEIPYGNPNFARCHGTFRVVVRRQSL